MRGPEAALLENQLDFLLLFLTSFQESPRALCLLRVPLDSVANNSDPRGQ
jgi:hypothetical protein